MELNRSSGIVKRCPALRKGFLKGSKGDFQITVSWILWHVNSLAGEITTIKDAPEEWGYTMTDIKAKDKKNTLFSK